MVIFVYALSYSEEASKLAVEHSEVRFPYAEGKVPALYVFFIEIPYDRVTHKGLTVVLALHYSDRGMILSCYLDARVAVASVYRLVCSVSDEDSTVIELIGTAVCTVQLFSVLIFLVFVKARGICGNQYQMSVDL